MAKLLHEDEYAALLADAKRYHTIRKQHEQWGGMLLVLATHGINTGIISRLPGALDAVIDKLTKEGN